MFLFFIEIELTLIETICFVLLFPPFLLLTRSIETVDTG